MLVQNLLLFLRNIKRDKVFFFINLIGLSAGLACTLLIYLWVMNELSVDRFHQKDKQLYTAMLTIQNHENIVTQDHAPGPLAAALREELPEVLYSTMYTHLYRKDKNLLSANDKQLKAIGDYVGKDFFNVFSYKLLRGNAAQVLVDKNSIVLSKELAIKLFKSTNVVGKSIQVDLEKELQITGVFDDIPVNASYRFDFLLPFDLYKEDNPWVDSWRGNGPGTAVLLKEGTDIEQLNKKVADFLKRKDEKLQNFTLFFKRYSDNYLYGSFENGIQTGGRIEYVRLFSIIAFFILLIACINFMNLSTAKASSRMKEIGIKKAAGADRKSLIAQYLGESVLMAFLGLFVAVLITVFLLPTFNEITDKQLALTYAPKPLLSIMGITLLTGLLAGSYPALFLSGLKPALILKGKMVNTASEFFVRKLLVIAQFTLAIGLIVGVLVIQQQIEFIQDKKLGYDKENVIYYDLEGWASNNLERFLRQQNEIPGILSASSMNGNFIDSKQSTDQLTWEGKSTEEIIAFNFQQVNYKLFQTLGITKAAGRLFSPDYSTAAEYNKVILNQTAANIIGFTDPLGKKLRWGGQDLEIIGIVNDFQFESLREKTKPMVFVFNPGASSKILVKLKAGKEKETLGQLHSFNKEFNPNFPFNFTFLDEDYQKIYASEQRISILSRYFAGLAILISCLGLFGLATFTAERRTKEIGIRKALSASRLSIVLLLSKDFTKLVLVAIFLALPLSYFFSSAWLNNFSYRIKLQSWFFLAAGLAALLVAWLTVGIQAIKAANKNPVDCLKSNE